MARILMALAAGGLLGVAGAQGNPPRVIGYFPEWGVYDRNYHIPDIPAAKLTHVNYAFARIVSNQLTLIDPYAALDKFYPGDCWNPGCARGSFNQITKLKQSQPHLKFLMSVGGWNDSAPFYALAANAAARQTFANSCSNFLAMYPQFDGIDLDWEHPVIGGLQAGSAADAHNFTLLLQAVRGAIGTNKLLTVAVSAVPASISALEYPQLAAYVDFINVMTYDFHGAWDNYTGHNSPLYHHGDPASAQFNWHAAVQGIINRGVPPAKLVPGAAFYGHSWGQASSSNLWSSARGAGPGTFEAGSLDYRDLATNYVNLNGYTRYWDDVAKVPWLHNAAAQVWISYDDPLSMQLKGHYARTHGLGGVMFWELSGDNGALIEALRAGLAATNFPGTGGTNLPVVTVTGAAVVEGNSGTTNLLFGVSLSVAATNSVSVNFATAAGSAAPPGDFLSTNGWIVFAPGHTNQTVGVAIIGDTNAESDEVFFFNLTSATNATIAVSQAAGTILNDDIAPPPAGLGGECAVVATWAVTYNTAADFQATHTLANPNSTNIPVSTFEFDAAYAALDWIDSGLTGWVVPVKSGSHFTVNGWPQTPVIPAGGTLQLFYQGHPGAPAAPANVRLNGVPIGGCPARAPRFLAIVRLTNGVWLHWTAPRGTTNVIQTLVPGGPAGTWQDAGSIVLPAGAGDMSTNWWHGSAPTNDPARFYRLRLP